ncbi:H-2 class I histocompatibility antigen, Q9 alpha chain-like [Hemicordylus capensis]|uniref:H-2 class I histocompatibility antigen, Q9 alpha chain-like n=1 Tax=Hemicordylus capensis TaxID=884348 RepID=UPI002303C9FF|nr:H-2 class I histocompatibility antigen, Q9 alpha chain-like [Hemicordylus capensis]
MVPSTEQLRHSASERRRSLSGSLSHSLHHFYLGVIESIQRLPWFTQVGYVDDQLFTRYDSNLRRDQPQVSWMENAENAWFWEWETHYAQRAERFFRQALMTLQSHYNQNEVPGWL